MAKTISIVTILFSLVSVSVNAFAQNADCLKDDRKRPKYKIVKSERSNKDGEMVLRLDVTINPKHLNRADMMELACSVNGDFPNEERLHVTFFTSARAARTFNEDFHPHSKDYERNLNALRGHYYLNRISGEEYVSFAALSKKPLDEERIDLRK